MIHVTISDTSVIMSNDDQISGTELRDTVPGALWDSLAREWKIPLTRRSISGLRKFLTGKDCQIDPHTGATLARTADSPQQPDFFVEKDRIIARFEFHKDYQNIMKDVGANLRQDGTWSIPVENVEALIELIESRDVDLMIDDSVAKLAAPASIPGFNGKIESLKGIPTTILKAVTSYKEPYKRTKSKKTPLSLDEKFSLLGINNLYDLVTFFPLRYLDRSNPMLISQLTEGDEAVIIGRIISLESSYNGRSMAKAVVGDEAGGRVTATFFSMPWIAKNYRVGQEVILSGTYSLWSPPNNSRIKIKQIKDPRMDPLFTSGKISVIPVYPQSEKIGVTTYDIMKATQETFNRLGEIEDPIGGDFNLSYGAALKAMHFPQDMKQMQSARKRLVHDELLLLQLHILTTKMNEENVQGISQPVKDDGLMIRFLKSLPYTLTGAQKRSMREISQDLEKQTPMRRLLQGDVSSGKTTVAHALMINAVDNGKQGVIIAPTEILAEQLYEGLRTSVSEFPIHVEFLGGKTTKKNKERILEELASGEIDIIVGTHALLTDHVKFNDLSTVVIDEQHRFGTEQRSKLTQARQDGAVPDMLVMTATPIPRTGAMVIYGDLDISVLDELPPGRVPIETKWLQVNAQDATSNYGLEVWEDIRQQVFEGHQAYVVASLVEESETIAAASAEEAYQILSAGPLQGLKLGLMHGKLNKKEKEAVMSEFAAGDIDVLVATTVIEVGVNVPNATVIAVLDPGRFGIAQLHQIRGRVGRASWQSRCWLVGESYTPDGIERLSALVESNNGFYLAEVDLKVRGEGALFGSRQSGISDLKIASLQKDLDVLIEVREKAQNIINHNDDHYRSLMRLTAMLYEEKTISS